MPNVMGEIDSRHAALAQLALDAVAVAQRLGETVSWQRGMTRQQATLSRNRRSVREMFRVFAGYATVGLPRFRASTARSDKLRPNLHVTAIQRENLYPASIAGRSRVSDTAHPVAYIHFAIRVSFGYSIREGSSNGVW